MSGNGDEGFKRIFSLQSSVVHGYVGNKSATFPLQLLGYEVDALNSVQLSNHTGYTKGHPGQILDDGQLGDLIGGLAANALDVGYSHVLTGYIGSKSFLLKTAQVIREIKEKNPGCIYVCDPVMGDTGPGMYVPQDLLPVYRETILPLADIVLPNQFEAQLLTGISIKNQNDALQAIKHLHEKGIETVVLSSVEFEDDDRLTAVASSKSSGEIFKIDIPKFPCAFVGTGDLFTALTTAWIDLNPDKSLKMTLEKVIATMQAVLQKTFDYAESRGKIGDPKYMELKLIQSKKDIENPRVQIQAIQIHQ